MRPPAQHSFLESLRKKIEDAYRRVAPNESDFRELLNRKNISIDIADRPDGFGTYAEFGIVLGSWWSLEALWACAYAVAVLGPRFDQANENKVKLVRLDDVLAKVVRFVLAWSINVMTVEERLYWPNPDWPYGLDGTLADADEHLALAEEVFLAAVGWICLHEFAHIKLEHDGDRGHAIENEREADVQATKWLFERAALAGNFERTTALMCALFFMFLREHSANVPDPHHPPVMQRMLACIATGGIERNAPALGVLNAMLEMFLQAEGHPTGGTEERDFETDLDALMDTAERVNRVNMAHHIGQDSP